MTIRKIQKFFAGVLTVSVLTASVFGGSALASETETTSETAAEAVSEAESETTESTGTRTIVDHTGAEIRCDLIGIDSNIFRCPASEFR